MKMCKICDCSMFIDHRGMHGLWADFESVRNSWAILVFDGVLSYKMQIKLSATLKRSNYNHLKLLINI